MIRLIGSELLRFRSRRLVVVVLGASLIGTGVGVVIAAFQSTPPTAEALGDGSCAGARRGCGVPRAGLGGRPHRRVPRVVLRGQLRRPGPVHGIPPEARRPPGHPGRHLRDHEHHGARRRRIRGRGLVADRHDQHDPHLGASAPPLVRVAGPRGRCRRPRDDPRDRGVPVGRARGGSDPAWVHARHGWRVVGRRAVDLAPDRRGGVDLRGDRRGRWPRSAGIRPRPSAWCSSGRR